MEKGNSFFILALILFSNCGDNYIKQVFKDEKGNIIEICEMKNNTRDGVCEKFDSTGKLNVIEIWKKGIQTDSAIYYDENGHKMKSESYKNGKINGIVKFFFKNGMLSDKYFYKGNQRHGLFISYHETGKIKEVGYFNNGLASGNNTYYNSKGGLTEKREYVILNNDSKLNQKIVYSEKGNVDTVNSNFFKIISISDTVEFKNDICFDLHFYNPELQTLTIYLGDYHPNFKKIDYSKLKTIRCKNNKYGTFCYTPTNRGVDTVRGFFDDEGFLNDSTPVVRRYHFNKVIFVK